MYIFGGGAKKRNLINCKTQTLDYYFFKTCTFNKRVFLFSLVIKLEK